MLFLLLCIGHIFLMLYPVNVNGGFVQNNDSNRIQILEGDWQVESVSQFLTKSNDFEDEQQRKTSEPLSQLQDTDCSYKLYDKFLNVVSLAFLITSTIIAFGFLAYSIFFVNFICIFLYAIGGSTCTILNPCDPLDLDSLASLTLGIYFCAIP